MRAFLEACSPQALARVGALLLELAHGVGLTLNPKPNWTIATKNESGHKFDESEFGTRQAKAVVFLKEGK